MTDTIKVEGDTRLAATLRIAAKRIEDMRGAADKTAKFVEGRGRSAAPRRTGRLSSSVRSTTPDDGPEITSGLPYANRTHWGYRRVGQRAQPFLASAVWDNEPLIVGNYATETNTILRSVKGA